MRDWFFIIFGISFLLASSIASGKFTPRTSRERAIAIVFIALLVLLAGWVTWQLLPYYWPERAVRVLQATPTPQEAPKATPANPKVVTITQPISIAVQYGSVGVAAGTKLPFLSRTGDKVRVRYRDGADHDIPISATDLK